MKFRVSVYDFWEDRTIKSFELVLKTFITYCLSSKISYYTYCYAICFALNKYTLGVTIYKDEIWMILVKKMRIFVNLGVRRLLNQDKKSERLEM